MSYDPSYIKQELSTPLPTELQILVEHLSVKVHDRWAHERLNTGWVYGTQRSDKLKTHPTLVPYDELPELEKDIDRATVDTVLKLVLKSGYVVSKV